MSMDKLQYVLLLYWYTAAKNTKEPAGNIRKHFIDRYWKSKNGKADSRRQRQMNLGQNKKENVQVVEERQSK